MDRFEQNEQNRRDFIRNAGLLSLSASLPGLAARHPALAGAADSTIEIHPGKTVTVLITVFTVQPENEQYLIDLLRDGTSSIFCQLPGYISASVHCGSDDKRLVLYGQWESQEYIDAFRKNPVIVPYFQKIKALASFESIVCNDVPFVHHK
jgi:quinol monooxygenase YgiN